MPGKQWDWTRCRGTSIPKYGNGANVLPISSSKEFSVAKDWTSGMVLGSTLQHVNGSRTFITGGLFSFNVNPQLLERREVWYAQVKVIAVDVTGLETTAKALNHLHSSFLNDGTNQYNFVEKAHSRAGEGTSGKH
jgi:hypothetical protein